MKSKSIEITGIQRALPDSIAKDGACREIINARFRKGCWRPIQEKRVFKNWDLSSYSKVFMHDIENGIVPGESNVIGLTFNEGDVLLYLFDENGNPVQIGGIIESNFLPSVVFLKQTMIVCTSEGVITYLWKDGQYSQIETLPVPQVDLSIFETTSVESEKFSTPEGVLGAYYKELNDESENNGRMYGSIMYIVAYRLFDGSYVLHSTPKYLAINNGGTLRRHKEDGVNYFYTLFSMSKVKAILDNELYQVNIAGELIDSVVVFATKATPLHNISETTITKELLDSHSSVGDNWGFTTLFPVNEDFKLLAKSSGWYQIASFSFTDIIGKTGKQSKTAETIGFYQDYATRTTLQTDQFSHHKLSSKYGYVYNDRLHLLNIKTVFGKPYVNWIESSEGLNYGKTGAVEGKITVWLKSNLGNGIVSNVVDIPIFKKVVLKKEPFDSNIIAAQAFLDALEATPSSDPDYIKGTGFIESETDINGNTFLVFVYYKTISDDSNEYYFLPPVISYNDSRAYKIRIDAAGKTIFDKPLVKNESMNFAFWANENFSPDSTSSGNNYAALKMLVSGQVYEAPAVTDSELLYDTNRLQVSEIQNPLVFPAKNSYQVGTGDGLAIAAGSTPLSSGQFGQFPLQVFTTKGIWAMEVGTGDVLYTNIVPAGNEVVNNVQNIVPIPGGVCYTTDYGLFVVSGLKSVQLSEVIENDGYLINLYTLPEIVKLCSDSKFAASLSNALSDVDFNTYLQNSKIGYDHENKELIVTNSEHGYSYLYSIENQGWYKISKSYISFINAYPKLYAVTNSNVRSISEEEESFTDVLFITMSQPIDAPEVYKKIERLIFRCRYTTVAEKYPGFYIFASNDQLTWQLIGGKQKTGAQINDLLCQRSHGSAKYYMFVFAGFILGDSELKQIDLIYDIKLANKLR